MSTLKYHKYILKSTPYGQLQKAISNLQKVAAFDPQQQQIQQTLKQFNEQHLSLITINTQPVKYYPIFNKSNHPSNKNKYIDQYNKKIYTINHLTKQLVSEQQLDLNELNLPEPVLQLINYLSPQVQAYVNKYFRQTFASQVFMQIDQQLNLNIYVAFTSKNVQLTNYITGEWTSIYKINKSKIQGTVNIHSHIFEAGNVQMNQQRKLSKNFQFTQNMQDNAKEIVKIIQKFQKQTQSNLSDIYEEMSSGFFKNLRRIAPITKTKMVWNVNSLKMNKNLLQGKN